MATLKFQFKGKKAVECADVPDNQPFNLTLQKTDIAVGNGMRIQQDSATITIIDGKDEVKIFIE